MKKQTFLKGSLMLTLSALLTKLLGACFKLPLTAMLGGTGMGYFSCAYGLFLPLYAVLVTGLSTAVACPVAELTAKGDYAGAERILHTARVLFSITGLAGTATAVLAAKPFVLYTAESLDALPAALCIAPAVLFSCLMAVERGYYEGLCSMTPTAASQAAEAAVKLVCGLYFSRMFPFWELPFPEGCSTEAKSAAGAVFGVMISTAAGYGLLLIWNGIRPKVICRREPGISGKQAVSMLLRVFVPVALGSLVTNLTSMADLVTMMRSFREQLASDAAGFYEGTRLSAEIPPEKAAAFVYGSFMGMSMTIFNLVPSLTNMFAKGVLPCTAQAWAAGRKEEAMHLSRQVLLLTAAAAVPGAIGIAVLPGGVLKFLFSGRDAEIQTAVEGLCALMPGLVCLCMVFPIFSLLQAMGRADMPVKIMLVGTAVKCIGNALLLPKLYTAGAGLSTSLCYGIILLLSWFCLSRVLGAPLHLWKPLAWILYAGICCGAAAWAVYGRTAEFPQRIRFLLAAAAGGCMYAGILWMLTKSSRKFLPEHTGQRQSVHSLRLP